MTPADVSRQLASRADAVCQHLLPGGKRIGAEWCTGSVNGDDGKSLKIRISGDKAGQWADFANQQEHHGDLLDLWQAVRGCSLSEALKQARAYLGIQAPTFEGHKKQTFRRPPKPNVGKPRDSELDYLTGERKLSAEAISAYKLAASGGEICFPYLRDGELIAAKYLKAERVNGKKQMRMEKDCEPCLFGWQAIPDSAREVTITEGEIDAISLWQMGKPALSIPNGAQGHSWIEYEFDNLDRFDTIFLCFDNDEPGQAGVREVANRLGLHRCRVVNIPPTWKDANDLLRANMGPMEIAGLFDKATTFDPVELRSAASYVDDVIKEFQSGGAKGFLTPWPKLSHQFKFRRGEVTLFSGARGHGKSEAVGQITLAAMDQGVRSCVASLEFLPHRWIKRLTRQAAAVPNPSEPYIRAVHKWYEDKLWAFAASGSTKVDRLFEIFEYARRRYGVELFVIDNLAKCGFGEDDYNGQKGFMDRLTDFARDTDTHAILVHHKRKGDYSKGPGSSDEAKGTGALADLADNTVVWWRNKEKEEARKAAERISAPFNEAEQSDAVFLCDKQRNGDHEPTVGLWFNSDSHQFLDSPGGRPKHYVKWSGANYANVG